MWGISTYKTIQKQNYENYCTYNNYNSIPNMEEDIWISICQVYKLEIITLQLNKLKTKEIRHKYIER